MSAENQALVRRFFDAVNQGDLEAGMKCLSADYVWHGPGFEARGPEGWRQLVTMFRSAFPDVTLNIEDQFSDGEKVATRHTARGTHRGEYAGVPASGRAITVPCLNIERVVDGRIVESWELFDNFGVFQAIGTFPALATTA